MFPFISNNPVDHMSFSQKSKIECVSSINSSTTIDKPTNYPLLKEDKIWLYKKDTFTTVEFFEKIDLYEMKTEGSEFIEDIYVPLVGQKTFSVKAKVKIVSKFMPNPFI